MKILTVVAFVATLATPAVAQRAAFTLSNESDGNGLIAFVRSGADEFAQIGPFDTGGLGSGSSLGSQNPLVAAAGGEILLAANAGSDDVSMLRLVGGATPIVLDIEPSRGDEPVSVAVHGDLVYVLNAGENENVAGFRLLPSGQLDPIDGTVYALSDPEARAAQVQFDPTGNLLVVTERETNLVTVFPVLPNGELDAPTFVPAPGDSPFAFEFSGSTLVVSEAAPSPDSSALSSFDVLTRGAFLDVVSSSVQTNSNGACWVAVTDDGRYAYTANTPSGTISGFAIDGAGALTLVSAGGTTADVGRVGGPRDIVAAGRFLFTVIPNGGRLAYFRLNEDGSLSQPGYVGALPASSTGLLVL